MSDIEFKDFIEIYKDYTKEPVSFLVNSSDNQLRSRENLLQNWLLVRILNQINKFEQNKAQYDLDIQTDMI